MAVQPILIYLIPSNKIGEEIPNGETAVTHEKEVYGKIFLYTNVKIIKCQEYRIFIHIKISDRSHITLDIRLFVPCNIEHCQSRERRTFLY